MCVCAVANHGACKLAACFWIQGEKEEGDFNPAYLFICLHVESNTCCGFEQLIFLSRLLARQLSPTASYTFQMLQLPACLASSKACCSWFFFGFSFGYCCRYYCFFSA